MSDQLGPVKFIIAGYEHSGTTMLSEIFRQAPGLDSGFECGFLLAESPENFRGLDPYYKNLPGGWGLEPEDVELICAMPDWGSAYQLLLERASKLAKDTTAIFDKTPRYLKKIDEIMARYADLKAVILVRDFRSLMYSTFRRSGMELDEWLHGRYENSVRFMNKYIDAYERLSTSPGIQRTHLIRYEDLCFNTKSSSKRAFEFLGLQFSEDFLNFPDPKFSNVYQTGVNAKYAFQFQDMFDDKLQTRIREDFSRRPGWFCDIQE